MYVRSRNTRTEMYAGRVACCPWWVTLSIRWRDRQTDGRTDARSLHNGTLSVRRGQRDKASMTYAASLERYVVMSCVTGCRRWRHDGATITAIITGTTGSSCSRSCRWKERRTVASNRPREPGELAETSRYRDNQCHITDVSDTRPRCALWFSL